MNKPSERIVVFVTPAQKRAIAASAEKLGISVSELMRRAVLSFGATSEQVKAASIVDRLRAPRAPDALDAALQRVARGTRHTRAVQAAAGAGAGSGTSAAASLHSSATQAQAALPAPSSLEPGAPLLPAGVLAALAAAADAEASANANAATDLVARIATAETPPGIESTEPTEADSLITPHTTPRATTRRPRIDTTPDEGDPTTEGGRFA